MRFPSFSRVVRILRRLLAPALLLAVGGPAAALERGPYSLEVLVNGVPLAEYAGRAKTYVEAVEGCEYSLRLRNHTGGRIAVALSVDGLNSIDAKTTTAHAAAKWILGPYETVTLDGWQTGSATARRFFFTTEEKSYGSWLGKTSNLGTISAAVFREKARRMPIQQAPTAKPSRSSVRREGGRDAPGPAEAGERVRAGKADAFEPEAELSEDLAATGIGREIEHRVRRVRFESERSPAAVMELRYEYRDALVKLGVLPPSYAYREEPLDRREHARGFEEPDFAPDPFRAP